jgi:FMNH2-dependent dimethyl sulfone monooxygenase
LATERLKVIAAVHPGLWQPAVLAKLGATADQISGGRFAVNVVSGWFKDEFTTWASRGSSTTSAIGAARSSCRCSARSGPRTTWISAATSTDPRLHPPPLNTVERPHPELFQGGNSTAARRNGGRYADGTSPTARTSPASPNRSSMCASTPAPPAAR